jgi:cytochrome b
MPNEHEPSRAAGPELRSYEVWDRPTRVLHWTNALLAMLVVALGLLFMFRSNLAIDGKAAKVSIMSVHSVLGYCLALGVCARIVWGFGGNRHVRWPAVLPTRDTPKQALGEAAAIAAGRPFHHELGHGPLGRLSTTFMLAMFLLMFGSGAVQAATDLKHPPLWNAMAGYVAKLGSNRAPADLRDKTVIDSDKARHVLALRSVAVRVHSVTANLLIALLVLHVLGVSLKELRHGGGLLSSMLTGRKVYASPPDDSAQ